MVRAEAKRALVEVLEKQSLTSRERAFWAISRNMHSPPLSLLGEGVLSLAPWYTNGETLNLAMVNRKDLVSAWLVSNKTYNLRLGEVGIESFNTDERYTERLSGENREWNCFVDDLLMSDPSKAVVSIAEIDEGDGELMGMKYAVTFEFIKGGEICLGKAQRHSWRIGTHFESEDEGKLFLGSFGEVMEGPNKRNYVRVLQKEALYDLHKNLHKFKPYEDWEYEIMGKSFNFQYEHESIKAIVDPISFHQMQIDEQGRAYGIDHRTGKIVLIADVFTNKDERADWLLREREIKAYGYSRRRVVGGSISSVTAGEQEVEEIEDIIQRNPDGTVTQFALKMAKGVPIALREETYEYLEQNPLSDPKDLSLFIASKIDEMPENLREGLLVFKEGVLKGMGSYEAFRGRVGAERERREIVRNILPDFRREDGLFLRREILERRVTVPIDEILRWRKIEWNELNLGVTKLSQDADLRRSTSVILEKEIINDTEELGDVEVEPTIFSGEIFYWEYLEEPKPVLPEVPGGEGVVADIEIAEEITDRLPHVHEFVNEGKGNNFESVSDFTRLTIRGERKNEKGIKMTKSLEKEREVVGTEVTGSVERNRVVKAVRGSENTEGEEEAEGTRCFGQREGQVLGVVNANRDLDDVVCVDKNVERLVVLDKIPYVREIVSGSEVHDFVDGRVSEKVGKIGDIEGVRVADNKARITSDELRTLVPVRTNSAGIKWEGVILIKDLPIGETVEFLYVYPVDVVRLGIILRNFWGAPVLMADVNEWWAIETGKKFLRDLSKNGGVYLSTILLILVPAILYWIGNFEQVLA